VEAPLPKFLAKTGYKGIVYREPYGVTLIIGPFNGPLLLLIRPAISALAAGNTCVLKLSEQLGATAALLMELVPRYFDPRAVTAVKGGREEVTELLKPRSNDSLSGYMGRSNNGRRGVWSRPSDPHL
jgi:aldehyde dehydrogenase (NAD+)